MTNPLDTISSRNRTAIQNAINYIKHVGANWTMRGQPHPQQKIVDDLEYILSTPPATVKITEEEILTLEAIENTRQYFLAMCDDPDGPDAIMIGKVCDAARLNTQKIDDNTKQPARGETPRTDEAEDRCNTCGLVFVPREEMEKIERESETWRKEADEWHRAFIEEGNLRHAQFEKDKNERLRLHEAKLAAEDLLTEARKLAEPRGGSVPARSAILDPSIYDETDQHVVSGLYSVGEPENEEGYTTVLNRHGEAMTPEEIVRDLNQWQTTAYRLSGADTLQECLARERKESERTTEQHSSVPVAESQAPLIRAGDDGVAPGQVPAVPSSTRRTEGTAVVSRRLLYRLWGFLAQDCTPCAAEPCQIGGKNSNVEALVKDIAKILDASPPSSIQPATWIKGSTAKVDSAVQEYLLDYEFRGDDGVHTPDADESLLIEDAIQGLLVDEDFISAFVALHSPLRAIQPPRWIPVGESLPDYRIVVLAANSLITEMMYLDLDGCWYFESGMIVNVDHRIPTHWMPMPKFPQEGSAPVRHSAVEGGAS